MAEQTHRRASPAEMDALQQAAAQYSAETDWHIDTDHTTSHLLVLRHRGGAERMITASSLSHLVGKP